jgi:hypothetical protein
MSSQKEIMSRLKWPTLGDIPYQYNPPRPRGFLGMEYPLVQGTSGAQWGYGAMISPPSGTIGPGHEVVLTNDYMTKWWAGISNDSVIKTLPMDASIRSKWLISKIKNDPSFTTAQKIQLLEFAADQTKGSPLSAAGPILLAEAGRLKSFPVAFVIGGATIAGIAGVVGFMLYRRSKK